MKHEIGKQKTVEYYRILYDYCKNTFQIEEEIKIQLERKATFTFTLVTVFLGSFFLNIDILVRFLNIIFSIKNSSFFLFVIFNLALLLSFVILSLIYIIFSIRIRKNTYKSPYPENITDTLFSPNSNFAAKDELSLLREISFHYSLVTETNRDYNRKKSFYLKRTFVFITFSLISFAILLSILSIYSFYI